MRKSISLAIILAGMFVIGFNSVSYAIDDPSFGAWENKSRATGDNFPVRVLKMVRNAQNLNSGAANASQMLSGDAVVYSTVSDDGISVTYTTTSHDATFAGICATTIPSSDQTDTTHFRMDRGRRNWGWIVVHGPADAKVTAGGTNGNSAGDTFITSSDAGSITGWRSDVGATDAVVARQGTSGGFFQDAASGTATSVEVFVRAE